MPSSKGFDNSMCSEGTSTVTAMVLGIEGPSDRPISIRAGRGAIIEGVPGDETIPKSVRPSLAAFNGPSDSIVLAWSSPTKETATNNLWKSTDINRLRVLDDPGGGDDGIPGPKNLAALFCAGPSPEFNTTL